ncbi:exported protein [Mycobacterium tuberculosis M1292]|nr:exported protein [Mycobacterium tuberculosis M1292]
MSLWYKRMVDSMGWVLFWRRGRRPLETKVVLDWDALPPVARIELMTTHDLAKREKQKLELLRSLLTYFHYASKETRPDVFRSEIDRINRAAAETQDRWRARQVEVPTEVSQRSEGQGPQPTRIPAG